MKSCLLTLALLVLPAAAQEQKQRFVINVGTPEGEVLQAIGQESDDSKKIVLMQGFLAKYPKHEGAAWVSGQLQAAYLKQKEYDKAIDAGEKGLASDPADVDLAYNNLKAAEGKDDPDLVKVWATRTSEIARKIVGKAPADDEEKQHADYAKQVDTYTGYALYAATVKARDPKKITDLAEALEQNDPKSQYLSQVSGTYLNALVLSGQTAKACPAAERLAGNDPKDTDALIFAADCNLRRNSADKAAAYSTRFVEALGSKPKPEGVSDADWASKKQSALGRAHWIAGVAYGSQNKFGPCDKALRAALPLVRGDAQMTGIALFYLGLSNYSLGKAVQDKAQQREGLRYFEQCAAVKGPMQDRADKNARSIKAELGIR